MRVDERLNVLLELHDVISNESGDFPQVIDRAYQQNKWFTVENIRLALKNISGKFLNESKLKQWISAYPLKDANPKTIGIVMAGNIPLVGFHDFICAFMSSNRVMVKLSSKDEMLFMFLLHQMLQKNPRLKEWITITQVLKGMDAIIATGSNNSSRYFEYYFSKYPHIITGVYSGTWRENNHIPKIELKLATSNIPLFYERILVDRVISNLYTNALKYTPLS